VVDKLKIMDWLVHGGHQYEFFKTNHNFVCSLPDGSAPDSKSLGRPINKNVSYVDDNKAKYKKYNIFMVRGGVNPGRYNRFRINKIRKVPGIAVMQTYLPYEVPGWVRCIVWNSKIVMDRYHRNFPGKKHFYIPHGFDPNEFCFLNLERNNRVLSAASLFKQRSKVLGFNEWRWVSRRAKCCDLIGHGNDGLSESIGCFTLNKLVRTYNEYSVFLNTTTNSAMPRVRAESLMCGTPLVTTNNFGINRYLVNEESCLFADTKEEMLSAVKRIVDSEDLQQQLSLSGRAIAVKYFHIDDYISKWNHVFEQALL